MRGESGRTPGIRDRDSWGRTRRGAATFRSAAPPRLATACAALALVAGCAGPQNGDAATQAELASVPARHPVFPAPERAAGADLQALVERVHASCVALRDGANADYIPALRDADPEGFGVAIVTVDGALYTAGDCDTPFAIMSAAKPFTAALVIEAVGTDALVERIGVEPTGEPFNSVTAIELHPERSINPLVNAGAIAAVSMLGADDVEARWALLDDHFARLAGERLEVMDDVLASVGASNHRNRAIANLLFSYDRLYCEPAEALEAYNRQSCLAVTTVQLARMAACLANGGVRPSDDTRVVDAAVIDEVLAVTCMAGFYDESGRWAYTVGLPAKSGVGGGIWAVAPGRMAIAAWSPRLNGSGNSVRASAAIREIAQSLDLSLFRLPQDRASAAPNPTTTESTPR